MAFGRLERDPGSRPMSDINMTPLIDVMLVLLVIFIITAPLLTHAVKLELPRASAQPNDLRPNKVDIAIDAQGTLHWDGQAVTRSELQHKLAEAATQAVQPELQLRADQNVAYRVVAQTLADASKAGLGRIGFVSEPEPTP